MCIETERLILRPHTPADFEDYFGYIMDGELQRLLGLNGLDNVEFLAVISRESGRVIGHICIEPPVEQVARAPEFQGKKGASLTFAIARAEQRKGLMLEALTALIRERFRAGAVDYFDCEYTAANTASRGLQEKLGFRHWGKEQLGDVGLVINILQNPA